MVNLQIGRPVALPAGITTLLLVAGAASFCSEVAPATGAPARVRLEDASPSMDDLLDRFLASLAARDKAALRRLRVTEDEYRRLILPGSVDPGQALRAYRDDVNKYFWDTLNGKSIYYEANLLYEMGGHQYRVKDVTFRKGTKSYATYKGYKQLSLVLENEHGQIGHLDTGSIAEVDGQFKFISFIRD